MKFTHLQWVAMGLGLAGCSREDLYGEATFSENVYDSFADCNPQEISFLAAKHNIQTAFRNCGSNKFSHFAWSPNGVYVYFQLTHGGHIMDAESKTIVAVPTESPVHGAAWLSNERLAVPLGPAQAAEGVAVAPARISVFDREQRAMTTTDLSVAAPQDLQPGPEDGQLVLTALDADGIRRPYTVDPLTGAFARALPWMEQPAESLVWNVEAGLVGWSNGTDGELFRAEDGSSLGLFSGAKRVVPHDEGRYVVIEVDGEAISLFDQRTWNELSPESQKREQQRKEQWLERLPEWAPREARPPEIHLYDIQKDTRVRVTSFYGSAWQWWPRPYWGSFILWGIEGKQLHRNIALTDIAERMRMVDQGDIPMGVELVTKPVAQDPSLEGAAPAHPDAVPETAPPAGEPSPG